METFAALPCAGSFGFWAILMSVLGALSTRCANTRGRCEWRQAKLEL